MVKNISDDVIWRIQVSRLLFCFRSYRYLLHRRAKIIWGEVSQLVWPAWTKYDLIIMEISTKISVYFWTPNVLSKIFDILSTFNVLLNFYFLAHKRCSMNVQFWILAGSCRDCVRWLLAHPSQCRGMSLYNHTFHSTETYVTCQNWNFM